MLRPYTRPMAKGLFSAILVMAGLLLCACGPHGDVVIIYTSVDQVYSEPILARFEEETGIEVRAVYDVEAAKTTGLVNRLIAERANPQADVFWNGEFAQTVQLAEQGVLAPYRSPNAEAIPPAYKDSDGAWTGFGGRVRVLLANTDLVAGETMPDSIHDLADPARSGDRLGIAYPLFGTTATQAAALYAYWGPQRGHAYFKSLAERGVRVVDGNSVVRDMVVDGRLDFGLTDTDDACTAVEKGAPVRIIVPDQGPGEMGTMVIPNTVALIAGGPSPDAGKRLIDYLLSEAVAAEMVAAGWSHVALGSEETLPNCLAGGAIRGMDVPLADVVAHMEEARTDMTEIFVR